MACSAALARAEFGVTMPVDLHSLLRHKLDLRDGNASARDVPYALRRSSDRPQDTACQPSQDLRRPCDLRASTESRRSVEQHLPTYHQPMPSIVDSSPADHLPPDASPEMETAWRARRKPMMRKQKRSNAMWPLSTYLSELGAAKKPMKKVLA